MRLAAAVCASVLAAAGCVDEDVPLPDANPTEPITRPMVTGIAVPADRGDQVALAIGVRDAGSPTIELLLAFACDDDTLWHPVTTASPLTELAVAPEPVTHEVRWDAGADVDLGTGPTCRVKVVALDPEGLSSEPLMAVVPLGGPACAQCENDAVAPEARAR